MSDLDLPLLPSAEQIRRRQFATVRRGYDPDQVHDYLNQVALQVEALEGELREQRLAPARVDEPVAEVAPVEVAPVEVEPEVQAPRTMQMPQPMAPGADVDAAYERISERFASVLRAADDEAQKLIDQARAEATKLLDDARAQADRIRVDAQSTAEDARAQSSEELQRAKAEADRVLGGLEQRRESLLGQMHEMQSRLLAVAQNLEIPDDGAPAAPPPSLGAHIAQDPAPAPVPSERDEEPVDKVTVTEEGSSSEGEPAQVSVGKPRRDDDAVDPRYEDMWAAPRPVDLPDLSSIDIDFDEEESD